MRGGEEKGREKEERMESVKVMRKGQRETGEEERRRDEKRGDGRGGEEKERREISGRPFLATRALRQAASFCVGSQEVNRENRVPGLC